MRRGRKRTLLIALVTLASLLLLAVQASGTTTPSGLYGKVLRGPITPVCAVEVPCYAPAKDVTLVFSRGGRVVGRATTGDDGKYRIRLPAGMYDVRRARTDVKPVEPDSARVPIARFVRADFKIDTGIR